MTGSCQPGRVCDTLSYFLSEWTFATKPYPETREGFVTPAKDGVKQDRFLGQTQWLQTGHSVQTRRNPPKENQLHGKHLVLHNQPLSPRRSYTSNQRRKQARWGYFQQWETSQTWLGSNRSSKLGCPILNDATSYRLVNPSGDTCERSKPRSKSESKRQESQGQEGVTTRFEVTNLRNQFRRGFLHVLVLGWHPTAMWTKPSVKDYC